MKLSSRTTAFALLAMFGIVVVLFVPAARGPFSVTHGPATAFRALAAARAMFEAIGGAWFLAMLRSPLLSRSLPRGNTALACDSARIALRC